MKLKPAPKWPDDLVRSDPLSLPKAVQTDSPWSLIQLDTVAPVDVHWFWFPYIPRGRVTSIEGDPGVGKSWFTCGLAAAVSRGMKLPGMDEAFTPSNVLMLSVEDGLADTVVPRLISLDADMSRVYVPREAMVLDEEGMRKLETAIGKVQAKLVVIDPVQFFMGAKTDMNTANQVRSFTAPLALVAERTDTAICMVRHMRKASGDGKAIYAGLGSIDFAASVRSILQVVEGDEGVRFVNHVKSNNAPRGLSISFALTGSTIEWGDLVDPKGEGGSANKRGPKTNKIAQAEVFLKAMLANGPVAVTEVEEFGETEGFKSAVLAKAKEKVGAVSFRRDGIWWWQLDPGTGSSDGADWGKIET